MHAMLAEWVCCSHGRFTLWQKHFQWRIREEWHHQLASTLNKQHLLIRIWYIKPTYKRTDSATQNVACQQFLKKAIITTDNAASCASRRIAYYYFMFQRNARERGHTWKYANLLAFSKETWIFCRATRHPLEKKCKRLYRTWLFDKLFPSSNDGVCWCQQLLSRGTEEVNPAANMSDL